MKCWFISSFVFVSCLLQFGSGQEAEQKSDPRFAQILAAIELHLKSESDIAKERVMKYLVDLKALETKVGEDTGDLDMVLLVRKERKAWTEGKTTPTIDPKDDKFPLELRKLRYYFDQDFQKLKEAAEGEKETRKAKLIEALTNLETTLTKERKIEEALKVRDTRVKFEANTLTLAKKEEPQPSPEPAEPESAEGLPTEGLVFSYDFEKDPDGVTRVDVQAAEDRFGEMGALSFSKRTENHVKIPQLSALEVDQESELTVALWVHSSDPNAKGQRLFSTGSINWTSGFWIGMDQAGGRVELSDGNDNGINVRGVNRFAGDGIWHHLAVVFDNGIITLYFDGRIDNRRSMDEEQQLTPSGDPVIGASYNLVNAHHFNGSIDDLHIYNRALSTEEIRRYVVFVPRTI
ncbi:MAG: LamG domain-containing protein [Verrucomicrobiota bacterium]